jgi:hypothetical protein
VVIGSVKDSRLSRRAKIGLDKANGTGGTFCQGLRYGCADAAASFAVIHTRESHDMGTPFGLRQEDSLNETKNLVSSWRKKFFGTGNYRIFIRDDGIGDSPRLSLP